MSNPQDNPGVAASQPSGEGPPAQGSEASPAAKPFGAPNASGGGNEGFVPRGLVDRLSEKLERREARIAELEALHSSSPAARAGAQPQSASVHSDQIDLLNQEISNYLETDPGKAVPLLRKVAKLEAEAASSSLLEGFLKDQQSQATKDQYQRGMEQSWARAMTEFPELSDQNSEFYQEAGGMWSRDQFLQADPEGMLKAARLADRERQARGGRRPPTLEGGGTAPVPTGGQKTVDERYSDVRKNLQIYGDKKGLEDFIEGNFNDLLHKDANRRPE